MLYSWMIEGYKLLKSMTRTYLSQSPRLGSKTSPPLNFSLFPPAVLVVVPSSSTSALRRAALFFPLNVSGQMYLRRWNSWRRMYSFRSARPPLRVRFLE